MEDKLKADAARVVIYDHNMFIIQTFVFTISSDGLSMSISVYNSLYDSSYDSTESNNYLFDKAIDIV
jgi:hypothetical protein